MAQRLLLISEFLVLLSCHGIVGFTPLVNSHRPTIPLYCDVSEPLSIRHCKVSLQLSTDSSARERLPRWYVDVLFLCSTSFLMIAPIVASAEVFAGRDIAGQNLSNGNYVQQDFQGVKAVGTNFRNSNLQGCNFNKADLSNADLTGSDVRGASFQGSILDGAAFKDVLAAKATFSASILDIQTLENADLTDTLWPSQLQIMICDMPELKGTSSNGVVTRESILCN